VTPTAPLTLLRAFVLAAAGCGGAAATPSTPAPARSATPAVARPEPAREEQPLTQAKVMLMTDFPLAPPMGEMHRWRRPFPLAPGVVGFLDGTGSRAVATLSEVRRIEVPGKLSNLCVGKDGKATFASTQEPGEAMRIWRASSFEAPMSPIGAYLTQVGDATADRQTWIVSDDATGTALVDCAAGTVEHLAPPSARVDPLHWSDSIRVLQLWDSHAEPTSCLLRTAEKEGWIRQPYCELMSRNDGSLEFHVLKPQPRGARAMDTCAFVLDTNGKKLRCDAPLAPRAAAPVEPARHEEGASLDQARFYARSQAVAPSREGALFGMTADGKLDRTRRIGAASLRGCTPLQPTRPLFRCIEDGTVDVVVSVGADGQAREELKRKLPQDPDSYARTADPAGSYHVTFDGGVAVGGDCAGNLGNVACVRTGNGTWHDVAFSPELVTALTRTAPATRLVPTPDGQLYVGVGTSDGILGGNVHVLVFRADRGPGVSVEKLPAWIIGSLSGMGNLAALLGSARGLQLGPSLGWSTSERVRVWPLEREHPAFHTKEFCRVDISLDGTFDAECLQGRLSAVGRMGLWEKRPGELYETLDAGESWAPVALPKGVETDDTVCSPLGCRIGPYWRMGWGGPPPHP
jgi:hypothetical protein